MIKVVSDLTGSVKAITLSDGHCPDDGAYKVLGSSDPDKPQAVIIVGDYVTFIHGSTLDEVCQYENLDHSYLLERCQCTITLAN